MLDENFKKGTSYKYLKELIEDIQDGERDIKYNIDKSIEKILDDDYLWDNFYNNIYADLVEKTDEEEGK